MNDALRVAVVGAGPSGFYATDQLLKAGFAVDLLELLPTPFGLVRAVVVGNGNVAVDVARMLVLAPEEIAATDTADHAVTPLGAAGVHEVIMLGRRGPAQAAFTNPELRELSELTRADIVVHPKEMELDPASEAWLASDDADATARRNVELLREY